MCSKVRSNLLGSVVLQMHLNSTIKLWAIMHYDQ